MFLSVSRKKNNLFYSVTGIVLLISNSITLFELGSFTKLNWLVCSGLKTLDEGDFKGDANKPVSFNKPKSFSLKFSNALFFFIEVSVNVFVKSREIS